MSLINGSQTYTHDTMIGYEFQRNLSKAQATPLFGIIPGSVKLLVSVIEVISGFACAILLGLARLLFKNPQLSALAYRGYTHINHGFASFFYSAFNILSLGFLAYKIENTLGGMKL